MYTLIQTLSSVLFGIDRGAAWSGTELRCLDFGSEFDWYSLWDWHGITFEAAEGSVQLNLCLACSIRASDWDLRVREAWRKQLTAPIQIWATEPRTSSAMP